MPDRPTAPRHGPLPAVVLVVPLEAAPSLILLGAHDEHGAEQLSDWISRMPVILDALNVAFARYRLDDEPQLEEGA